MAENIEEQALNDFLTWETKEYEPADLARALITMLSANEMDCEKLASFLQSLLTNQRKYGHILGMRQGYAIAEDLAKLENGRPEQKANAKIARVLMKNPTATTKEVCLALDNAEIPLHKSKGVPKHVRLWSEVAKKPYYKTLISRVRKRVVKASRLDDWQDMIWIMNSDGMKPDDILGIDPI
jgi:hypothetical protein